MTAWPDCPYHPPIGLCPECADQMTGPYEVLCEACGGDMQKVWSCTARLYVIDGDPYCAIPYGAASEGWDLLPFPIHEHCNDCGVLVGGIHHPGCDVEVCPACEGQRLGCDCDG